MNDDFIKLLNQNISKIKHISNDSILFILKNGSIIEFHDNKFEYLKR